MCGFINIISVLLLASGLMEGITPSSLLGQKAFSSSIGSKQGIEHTTVPSSDDNDNKNTEDDNLSPFLPRPKRQIGREAEFFMGKSRLGPPIRVPGGPPFTRMMGYTDTLNNSTYFDMRAGIYHIPVAAKYVFRVMYKGIENGRETEWHVCRGDGRWEKAVGERENGSFVSDNVKWDCEAGEEVWAEGMGLGGDAMVLGFVFYGNIGTE